MVVTDEPGHRFSEKWFLTSTLSPYLREYAFLAEDTATLRELRDLLRNPLQVPSEIYATGVFDADLWWAEQERDRQIRAILDSAKLMRSHESGAGIP